MGGEGGEESSHSLTEDERRALRGSKFAPLPPSQTLPRLAHPGGPVKTNKAAALAKFLERKLQQPDGLKSINPDLVELAVKNAKETVKRGSGGPSTSGRIIRHVASFEDSEGSGDDRDKHEEIKEKKRKRKKKKTTKGSGGDQDGHEEIEQKRRKRKKKKTTREVRSSKSHKPDKRKKIKK